jgi:hypothetical protein
MSILKDAPLSEISNHTFASIIKNGVSGEKALVSNQNFQKGDIVTEFEAENTSHSPSYLTLQTGEHLHITLKPAFLQYINHSCNPNVFFNTSSMQLVALKEICIGDEFVFFYPSTEWKMAQPFDCYCGSKNCLQHISGAISLPTYIISSYDFTDFIQHKLHNQLQK